MSCENVDERKTNDEQSQNAENMDDTLISGLVSITPKKKGQQNNINIQVCNPVVKEEKFSKYIAYTVKGADNEGSFEVLRRYSDFDKIRSLLVIRWPGCYIPPLPPKTIVPIGNMGDKFIEERRRRLHTFCQKISDIPYIHYSEEYQIFVRSANTDLEKTFNPMTKFDYDDLITKFSNTFGHLSGKEMGAEITFKIAAFKVFLQKTQAYFESCKKIAKSVAQARQAFYEQFSLFHTQVCVEYEKNIFSEYHGNTKGKNIFSDSDTSELNEKVDKIKQASTQPSLEYLYEWLKIECDEIAAFLEAIGQRDKYEAMKNKALDKQKADTAELNKILSGKTTMKIFFSRKSRDEEVSALEKQIEENGKDFEHLKTIQDMIMLIIAYDEIEKFKANKLDQYYYVVKLAAQGEFANTQNVFNYWQMVCENDNIKN